MYVCTINIETFYEMIKNYIGRYNYSITINNYWFYLPANDSLIF